MLEAPATFTIPDTIPDWEGFTYATPRDPAHRRSATGSRTSPACSASPGMPWQRQVWDVAGEIDAFGNLIHEIVIVTVPRQSGKTTMYGPVQIERAITTPGCKTFYTAQTGKDARSRFNDLKQLIEGSQLMALGPISSGCRPATRRSSGLTDLRNKIFAPVEAALHGETPPLVGMDEIWEFDELLGDALLEGAIIPAQVTLAGRRQVWLHLDGRHSRQCVPAQVGRPWPAVCPRAWIAPQDRRISRHRCPRAPTLTTRSPSPNSILQSSAATAPARRTWHR